ncbi:hypothetical protein OUZ56_001500 [Daphnia magna]|uniref:Uncharacterized protein n=1 Tax=Daphnia magna TaxID=35525 RepID=A0ABR0A3C8_9CRUS|nr:hypothetical protein OUZ56_001500 [Daphnia magna]
MMADFLNATNKVRKEDGDFSSFFLTVKQPVKSSAFVYFDFGITLLPRGYREKDNRVSIAVVSMYLVPY